MPFKQYEGIHSVWLKSSAVDKHFSYCSCARSQLTARLRDETQWPIATQTQRSIGRRHQDSSCSALIDSLHSCAPSIGGGVDNKMINEHMALVAMCHRLGPVINLSMPLKRSTGHQSSVRYLLLPFLILLH